MEDGKRVRHTFISLYAIWEVATWCKKCIAFVVSEYKHLSQSKFIWYDMRRVNHKSRKQNYRSRNSKHTIQIKQEGKGKKFM